MGHAQEEDALRNPRPTLWSGIACVLRKTCAFLDDPAGLGRVKRHVHVDVQGGIG